MMDPFIGTIKLFPYTFEPMGWAKCDGRLIPIQQNTALFSLIGNKFGGDGKTNFALPNLIGTESQANTMYCIAVSGIYPCRQ